MPLVLLPEMRRHFYETGTLEVESIFPQKILDEVRDNLKLLIPSSNTSFTDRYLLTRDLFRTQETFRRLEMRKEILHFIADLSQSRYLHLGCDQLFDWTGKGPGLLEIIPDKTTSVEDLMSITPLIMGMMICLTGEGPPNFFPSKPGNVTFFAPELEVDWVKEKENLEGRSFLFVGYAPRGAIVRFNPIDPHTNLLKRMDYQEGSPIDGRTHPFFRL